MTLSSVRFPNPVLHGQPREDFTLKDSPASPDASGVGGPLSALAQPVISGFRRIHSGGISRPRKTIFTGGVMDDRAYRKVEVQKLHVADKVHISADIK